METVTNDCLTVNHCLNSFKGCTNMTKKVSRGFYEAIGNGNATVWIEYSADKDYDNRGDFWEIDWDAVRVYYGEADITDTISDQTWLYIEEMIHEDLNK